MKTGLRLFGDASNEAVKSEMGQLHKRTVMKPKHSKDLTTEQWREALAYLMFLKQKRCGMMELWEFAFSASLANSRTHANLESL